MNFKSTDSVAAMFRKNRLWFAGGLLVLIAIGIGISFWIFGGKGESDLDKFARCLTEKGAKLYGLPTCPHCQEQKEAFGEAIDLIDYVDCSEKREACIEAGIESVPAWHIGDKELVGIQSFQKLGEVTGCKPPKD